jgi:hypothetical protein
MSLGRIKAPQLQCFMRKIAREAFDGADRESFSRLVTPFGWPRLGATPGLADRVAVSLAC